MFYGTQGDSTKAQAYYGRLEDGEAYIKYLKGTKMLKLQIGGFGVSSGDVKIVSWSDGDSAADKSDRKSVSECGVMIYGSVVCGHARNRLGCH